jgi:hypothetical protein
MSDQALTDTVAQLMAQMAAMQAKMDSLQAQAQVQAPPTSLNNVINAEDNNNYKPSNPSRRRMLRRLAGGMLAGLAVGTVAAAVPESAQARLVIDPTAPDSSRRVGAVVVPPGTAIPSGVPSGTAGVKYGLVATDGSDSTFDLTKLPGASIGVYSNGYTMGVYGFSSNTGVYGQGSIYGVHGFSSNTGVYGQGSNIGVEGQSSNTGVYGSGIVSGVYGNSTGGVGVKADSGTGVPFRIVSGAQPTSLGRVYGDMYVDANGNLFIWANYNAVIGWHKVSFVA